MDGVATDGFHLVFQETTPIQAANNRELFSKGMGKGGDWPPTLSPSTRKPCDLKKSVFAFRHLRDEDWHK
jgi:hypothetical protein